MILIRWMKLGIKRWITEPAITFPSKIGCLRILRRKRVEICNGGELEVPLHLTPLLHPTFVLGSRPSTVVMKRYTGYRIAFISTIIVHQYSIAGLLMLPLNLLFWKQKRPIFDPDLDTVVHAITSAFSMEVKYLSH